MTDYTREELAAQGAAARHSFDLLDWLEDDPAKRISQIQRVKMHYMATNRTGLDKEELKWLDSVAKMDLASLRLDVDKDSSQAMAEVAQAVAAMYMDRGPTDPHRLPAKRVDVIPPTVALDDLDTGEVPDWALSQELAEIPYEEVMGKDE